jgi:hypothetical protein
LITEEAVKPLTTTIKTATKSKTRPAEQKSTLMQSSVVTAALGPEVDFPMRSLEENTTDKKKEGSSKSPRHYQNNSISSVDKSMLDSIDDAKSAVLTSPVSETQTYS